MINQIVSALAALSDRVLRGIMHLQRQPGLEDLSLADTLVLGLVLAAACRVVYLSLQRLRQGH